MMHNQRLWSIFVSICLVITLYCVPAAATAPKMAVAVNQSRVLTFSGVSQVAVANPEIADVSVVSGSEILLIGKAPGITTLHIWSDRGRESYLVEVGTDDTNIANAIRDTLGYQDIRVSKINKTVILEGKVQDQYQRNRAEKVASAYGEKVINLLELTQPLQIKIEAKIVEVDREKVKNTGIKWGNLPETAPGIFGIGQSFVNQVEGSRVFGSLGSYDEVNGLLSALVKNGSAKILSQPNVITLSGDKASIMVGGEIPIPVSLDNGRITIEWKEYGIKLDIAPEINAEGIIQSQIKAEVSSLDWNSTHKIGLGAGMSIPPLKTRKASTAIALASGETMAIGGLIASETAQDLHKVPLLGDIPIIGQLFRSKSFTKGETELVIFITPTVVEPKEYTPAMTKELQEFNNEDPWRGAQNVGQDQGADSGR